MDFALCSMKRFYIIDGNSYLHRAYHALPPLTTSKGEQINAVYGFLKMVFKLIKDFTPDYLLICFDFPAPTFRHKEFLEYKAHRKEMDDSLKNQIPIAKESVKVLNLKSIEIQGFEADDIIATMAKRATLEGFETVIVTGDKDCLQLVNDYVKVMNEPKDTYFDREKVKEKYDVYPENIVDLFALAGDSSDNVPGVRGIGDKTASKLINNYGSVEKILEKLDTIPDKIREKIIASRENLLLSKHLIELVFDVPVDIAIKECLVNKPDTDKLVDFLKRIEAVSLAKDIIPVEEKKKDYKTILSEADFGTFFKQLSVQKEVSVDLETTGVNPLRADLVGISMSWEDNTGFYIPVSHNYLGCPQQLPKELILSKFKPILEDSNIKKMGQNIKYDYLAFKKEGIKMSGIEFDTMIASYCLNPNKAGNGLKDLSLEMLGRRMTSIDELIGKGAKQQTMDRIEIERVSDYACADADVVYQLAKLMRKTLKEKQLENLFHNVEMPLLEVLAEMEEAGIYINVPYLTALDKEMCSQMLVLEKEIHDISGEKFNINSPKQLQYILFEKLKLPPSRKTKTGYSTDEEVLLALGKNFPLPKKLIEYRELMKLKTTYIDSLLKLRDKNDRIHTSFNQAITATGRLSSSNPNLQNIPIRTDVGQKIRKAFTIEKGNILVSADYSQIDLRVMAHFSQDESFVKAFKSNQDIHTATASEIFGINPERVDTNTRRIAKTINFGIIYGMSAYGLAQQLEISNEEAQKYIDEYFVKYAGVKKWTESIIKEAKEKGYVTTFLNRIRYLPEINSMNTQIRQFAERTAVNTPIQGTAADIIKVAMINIHKKLSKLSTRMLSQVHDELLFEVPEKEFKAVCPMIKNEMENAVKLIIPLTVDLKYGQNWNEMTKYEHK
ncbi:MAG: DNA polymerase I [Elusimicrobia bacterium]|nr:DNA polymerase I [Elusimicrobiota bacterium]